MKKATSPQQILVAPSILSADFSQLKTEIQSVTAAGADWIHVDVMDGHFVPNITIGPPVVASLAPISSLPLDVHLMIENPEKYVEDFVRAGANSLTFHIEATSDPKSLCAKIRTLGAQPGITLRPGTSVDSIIPFLPLVDLVLIMTVNPGFSGQGFMPSQVEKIRTVKAESERLKISPWIEVDGGINDQTGKICREAGANVFVAGNYVFKNSIFKSDYASPIRALKGIK